MLTELSTFTGIPVDSPYLYWIAAMFVCLSTVLLFDIFRFVFFGHRG